MGSIFLGGANNAANVALVIFEGTFMEHSALCGLVSYNDPWDGYQPDDF